MTNLEDGKELIVIYRGDSKYDTLCVFSDELGKSLERLGYQVVTVDLNDETDTNQKINMLASVRVKAFIGFNGIGAGVRLSDGAYLQDVLNGPYYGFFVDHPVYQYNRLATPIQNMNAFVVDESHVDYIRLHHTDIQKVQMIPHGGIVQTEIQPYEKRKKDVVFFGSFVRPEKILEQVDRLPEQGLTDIVYNVIQRMLTDFQITIDMAFDAMLQENAINLSPEDYHSFMSYIRLADTYVRQYFRYLIIKTIAEAGIKIELYGEGWSDLQCNAKENLIIHEPVSCREACEIMNDSKIVLNVMPWFKKGSHERIFMAMLSGAVCITDESTYIDQEFADNVEIITYSLKRLAELPMKIEYLLKDAGAAGNVAEAGRRKAEEFHTWDNRAEKIVSYMEQDSTEAYMAEITEILASLENTKYNLLKYNKLQEMFNCLEQMYQKLTEADRKKIFSSLENRQKNNSPAALALNSFAMKYFGEPEYTIKLIDMVSDSEKYRWETKLTVYWYIVQYSFTKSSIMNAEAGRKLRELYGNVVYDIKNECHLQYEFRNKEKRNSNQAVVLISQFLTMEHGPTKTVLDRCQCLMEDYGMEIVLINTAEFMYNDKMLCLYDMNGGYYNDGLSGKKEIEYMGHIIPFYQCSENMPCAEEICRMAELIYETNPYFILNIGGNSPLTDICSDFCPTLTISTVPSSMATTLGQFQAIGRQITDFDREILKANGKSEAHIIESRFTMSVKPQESTHSRKELGLPEDKFVVVLVGGRLTEELEDELLDRLLYDTDSDTVVALAGCYDKYKVKAAEIQGFTDKIVNLGFQNDMLAVLDCCDLYINPRRKGGGTSSFEAMYKGIPLITLPVGDVGLAAGPDFHVQDYDEMIQTISKYKSDRNYYEEQSRKARNRGEELMDTSKEFGKIIDEMINRME